MIDRSVQTILQPTLVFLKQGELEQSHTSLERLLEQDLENPQILYTIKGVNFWLDRLRYARTLSDDFLRGEYIISQWKPFLEYINKIGDFNEPIVYALKTGAFTIALRFYQTLLSANEAVHTAEIYRKTGLCYKALGDYDTAINCLRYAADINPHSSAIIAELADSYAFSGEIRFAKVFFREAFFKNASEIELCFLESEIICALVTKVTSAGYTGEELLEWLPVYGTLDGILNVKRELKALELGRLKQSIYTLENEVREKEGKNKKILVPRLINYYFWLIDHYMNGNVDKSKIDEILLRIKLLDEEIYDRYIR
ncbi:MAG: tetratricopeptide repeat protein [Treponema sp.]